ncbi:Caffeine dehydrogenase subunit gamma [Beijerinckiaceae bacterium RH AL1]|nr:(2Fe-2S)-binding protein [Beijerinckiaceae bacterium]VVB46633.1 Caffeine dehydrogenase subunit gamma [Beijerinckiaceae bacterium RH CH11]VVB46717.1 Caffeine dehydrogenase subunit gamma [Beijerinckiaceae bacterium RH AL8]VVC55473.1 Caffeine dehydrogenase subunit gamma [Beijerinckiaceae bacterium RH AL1]
MPIEPRPVRLTVNGVATTLVVEPRMHLADALRTKLGLTGTHVGCEHGVCGACTVLLDGASVRSCLVLAVQAEGRAVETIEGLSEAADPVLAALQAAFVERNALQCGFCTPGMLATALELLRHDPTPSRETIRDALAGNYCRCTGYHAIVDAVALAASRLAEAEAAE